MSPAFAFFGAKDRDESPTLGEVLHRLLEPEEETPPRRGGRSRREAKPSSLEQLPSPRWFEAAKGATGELVQLRTREYAPDLILLGLDPEDADGEELGTVAATIAAIAGNPGEDEGSGSAPAAIVCSERAQAPALALLRHRAGGGRKFSARGGRVLVYLAERLAAAVDDALASNHALLDELEMTESGSIEPVIGIALDGGIEWVLSHFFLPPSFPATAVPPAVPGAPPPPPPPEAAAFWDSISVGAPHSPNSLWFAGSLGEPKEGFVVLFECAADRPDRQEYAAKLLPILRQAWFTASKRMAKLASAGSTPRFAGLAAPPEALARGAVRVSGEIRIGTGGFPVAVHLPLRYISLLSAALKVQVRPLGRKNALGDTVALNEALLERWESSFRDLYLRPRTPAGSERKAAAPPLAGLLASLGSRDAAVAIQNCILPHYGVRELPYLFFYHAAFIRNGKRAMRPQPFTPFREADILRLLPAAAGEEWERERKFDLPAKTVPPSTCVRENDEAARLIWEAARAGKIELSPSSYDLVEAIVGKRLEAAGRERLAAMATKDIPFGYLATLEKRDANRIVDRLPNRALALASVGDGRHLDLLRSAMGSGRRRDFDEELELAEKRLERGELEVEEATEAKVSLLSQMREFAEELKRERAALPDDRTLRGRVAPGPDAAPTRRSEADRNPSPLKGPGAPRSRPRG